MLRHGTRRSIVSFVAIALFLLVASAMPASAGQSVDRRLLVFSASRGTNVDIYVIRADGSGLRRLTRAAGRDDTPTWSPDGGQIAFRSWRDGNEEIYVMNGDGSDQRNISREPGTDRSPAWSPDGQAIAFAKGGEADEFGDDIWLMGPDGSNQRQLTHRVGIDEYPVWSPDGASIAFACTDGRILSSRNGDFEICLMKSDGSNVRRLTDAPGVSLAYSWSPDGRWLAFASSRADNPSATFAGGDLFLLEVATAKVRQLTRGAEKDFEPAFSPDGRKIAFGSTRRSRITNLFILTRKDLRIRQLTRLRGEVADPVWQP